MHIRYRLRPILVQRQLPPPEKRMQHRPRTTSLLPVRLRSDRPAGRRATVKSHTEPARANPSLVPKTPKRRSVTKGTSRDRPHAFPNNTDAALAAPYADFGWIRCVSQPACRPFRQTRTPNTTSVNESPQRPVGCGLYELDQIREFPSISRPSSRSGFSNPYEARLKNNVSRNAR